MRNRWLRGGAIALHIGALVLISAMLGLGWWQLHRALHGHARSWAYTVEWPAFAAYAGYIWWKLVHEEPGFTDSAPGASDDGSAAAPESTGDGEPSSRRVAEAAARAEAEDRALAEYNEHLAGLRAAHRRTDR